MQGSLARPAKRCLHVAVRRRARPTRLSPRRRAHRRHVPRPVGRDAIPHRRPATRRTGCAHAAPRQPGPRCRTRRRRKASEDTWEREHACVPFLGVPFPWTGPSRIRATAPHGRWPRRAMHWQRWSLAARLPPAPVDRMPGRLPEWKEKRRSAGRGPRGLKVVGVLYIVTAGHASTYHKSLNRQNFRIRHDFCI